MDIQDISAAFESGANLVNALGHVYLFRGIDDATPAAPIHLANLDTGREGFFRPAHILAFLGHVEETRLPFRVGRCRVVPREKVFSACLTLADGVQVQPGDRVRLETGEQVTYLGLNPSVETCPVRYRGDDGETYMGRGEQLSSAT